MLVLCSAGNGWCCGELKSKLAAADPCHNTLTCAAFGCRPQSAHKLYVCVPRIQATGGSGRCWAKTCGRPQQPCSSRPRPPADAVWRSQRQQLVGGAMCCRCCWRAGEAACYAHQQAGTAVSDSALASVSLLCCNVTAVRCLLICCSGCQLERASLGRRHPPAAQGCSCNCQ